MGILLLYIVFYKDKFRMQTGHRHDALWHVLRQIGEELLDERVIFCRHLSLEKAVHQTHELVI